MAELDKFKRRLIRSVARLLLQQKKQPDEVWEELKKETGCDCKLLWKRMRALTLKKLNRLLLADDKPDNVPAIARLTNTDWLLFDLVLVHEKIDVISVENKPAEYRGEFKPLVDLFSLVQRLNIENLSGEPLAEAWAAATIYYNIEGRQCSPMLLQRRWYQLKETTRQRFYNFWFSYRGNIHLLINAKKNAPSVLEMAIAKRYGSIITTQFVEWEELIQKKLVILPQEFESNMRKQNLPKLGDADSQDIVLVEPSIETIDLRMDSDSGEEKDDETQIASDPEKSNEAQDIKVKGNEFTDDQTANIIKSSETSKDETSRITSQIPQENVKVKMEIPDDYEVITVPTDTSNKVHDDRKLTGTGSNTDEILLPKISSVYGNLDIHVETTPSFSSIDNNIIIKDNKITEATIKSMTAIKADNDRDIECCVYDIHTAVNENIAYFCKNDASAINNKSSSNVNDFKDTTKLNKEAEISKDLMAGDILKQRAKEFIQKTQREMTSTRLNQETEFSKNLTADNILKQRADEFINKIQKQMTKIKPNEETERSKDLTPNDILKQSAEEFMRKAQKEMTSIKSNQEPNFIKDLTAEDILKQRAEEFLRKTQNEITQTKSNQETEFSKNLTAEDILKQRAEEFIRRSQKEMAKIKSNEEAGSSKDLITDDILKQRAEEFIWKTQKEMTSTRPNQETEFTKNLTADDILKQRAEEFINKIQKEMTKIKPNEETESSKHLTPNDILKQSAEEFIRKTQKEMISTKSNQKTEFLKHLTVEDILKQRTEEFIRKTQKEITPPKSYRGTEFSKSLTAEDILKQRAEEFIRKTQKEMPKIKSNEEAQTSSGLMSVNTLIQRAEDFIWKTRKETTNTKSNDEVESSKDLTSNDILKQKTEEFIQAIQKEITNRSILENNIETSVNSTRYMVETENITSNISDKNTIDNIIIDNVTKKETVPNSNITNTFDYSSTNWTLVDDGIELIDDGIEFVDEDETIYKDIKNENNDQMIEDKVEDIDTPKFDLKLLMCPVVYTTKLDLMGLDFKVMELYTIKGEGLINNIIKESKPISKLSIDVKEIKEEHKDNDSQQSISSTDKKGIIDLFKMERNDDDSDSEVEISEDRKVKSSSYMLQKPRNRSYNPIQLCKNPDFNTRLKRLPVGFFKSTRNLQLLKTCKPMTIDVHKVFETKLINGTLYLKSASSDTKSYEKQIDQKSERNQTATIVPSAMSVQSLIDNTIVECDLVSLGAVTSNQNISYQAEEGLLSERRKVINLPDITSVRRINQTLLTAEVPPIVYQNSDETHKHVEIKISGTQTNVGNSVPQVSKHIFNSKDNTKVNYLSASNLARLNYYNMSKSNKIKRRIDVPWSTTNPVEATDERLITDDTLEKVLHVLSGNDTTKPEHPKLAKKKRLATLAATKLKKQKGEKQIDDNKKKENQNKEKRNTNKDNSQQIKEVEVESKMKHIAVPKFNIKSKSKYCCWYREKICIIEKAKTSNKKSIRLSKHTCLFSKCICCCRDEPHDHIKKIKISKDTQTDAIVVSDDEEQLGLQKACESKESVNQECCSCKIITDDTSLSTCKENLSNKASQFFPDENIVNNSNLSTRNITQESITMVTQTVENTVENNSSEEIMSVVDVIPPLNTNDDCHNVAETESIKSTSTINETAPEFKMSVTTHDEPLTQLPKPGRDSIPVENITNNEKPSFIQLSASNLPNGPNIENLQRQIIIDGSNHKCLVPSTIVSKSEIKSPNKTPKLSKDTPLFIGKNTILLTTAKLPKTNDTIVHENSRSQKLSLTPLPDGVQLLLQPTGELHLVITPGVELTAEQLEALPAIVQEIQKQTDGLNISTVLNNTQINDTANDETAIDKTTSEINVNSKEKERTTIDEDNIPACNLIDKDINVIKYQKTVQLNEDNEKRTTKDINDQNVHDNENKNDVNQSKNVESSNGTNPNLISANISEIAEEKISKLEHKISQANDSNVSTNRKTILSDLMEMSGISSEDTMISQENITFSQSMHTAEEINLPSSSNNLVTNDISEIPELTVVTSLTELKYACENNGDFFKLNFTTGVLAPVKVCVKKNLSKKLAPKKIDPNTVIDLTEDNEFSNERASIKRHRGGVLFRNVSTPPPIDDSIKPLKLFKAKYPIILKRMKLGKKKINTICYDKAVNHQTKNKNKHRKQNLNKIEAKIDLVDSDAPMEEEYLIESDLGEEIESTTKTCRTEATLYDSSDDEPLAKKSKRINKIQNLNDSNNIVDGRVSKEAIDKNLHDCKITSKHKREEDNNASTSALLEVPGDTMFENLEYTENEESDNLMALNFLRNDSDNESCAEEDCILGV